jgi:hypothetical protein
LVESTKLEEEAWGLRRRSATERAAAAAAAANPRSVADRRAADAPRDAGGSI